ncbi:MAG: hypothetical protein AABZ39_21090 [Spirochaetota bacterium]
MNVNCYYYAPHNHTILREYLAKDLKRMKSLGTDIVSFCLIEWQMTNWHMPRIKRFIGMAHDAGLAVHVVPNRWAGLVAGWFDAFGEFTLKNMDTIIRREDGTPRIEGEMASCTQHPKVRDHMMRSIESMMKTFDIDGIIWDEPHSKACFCEHCRKAAPEGIPTDTWQHAMTASFLDDMTVHFKSFNSKTAASCFVMPESEGLLRAMTATTNIDYIGSDGHVRSPDHQMHRMKRTIFEAYEEFQPIIDRAEKKSFYLLEAQRHRDEDLENYLANVDRAFALPMDHLMYYYCAHEMLEKNNEERFNHATWNAVKRLQKARNV